MVFGMFMAILDIPIVSASLSQIQAGLSVRRQAEVMAISDVFLALTVVFLGCVSLAALMRRPAAAVAGGGGH